jgi:hypothetical protein
MEIYILTIFVFGCVIMGIVLMGVQQANDWAKNDAKSSEEAISRSKKSTFRPLESGANPPTM